MSVSTPVKTLAVNPAFLQEIKDSHLPFWDAWRRLDDCLTHHGSGPRTLRRLADWLAELRDLMALQFALEETYGYLEVPAGKESPQNHLLQDIRSQHCSLYLDLNGLTEQAEELLYRGGNAASVDALFQEVSRYASRFRDHERLEADLIRCAQAASYPW